MFLSKSLMYFASNSQMSCFIFVRWLSKCPCNRSSCHDWVFWCHSKFPALLTAGLVQWCCLLKMRRSAERKKHDLDKDRQELLCLPKASERRSMICHSWCLSAYMHCSNPHRTSCGTQLLPINGVAACHKPPNTRPKQISMCNKHWHVPVQVHA